MRKTPNLINYYEGDPITICFSPKPTNPITYILDEEKMLSARDLQDWGERQKVYEDAQTVISGWDGDVQILDAKGDEVASFSGPRTYAGNVNNVIKVEGWINKAHHSCLNLLVHTSTPKASEDESIT